MGCALSLRRIGQCQGHIPESPPIFSRLKSSQGSNNRVPWWSESECLDRKSEDSGCWHVGCILSSFFPFPFSFPTSFFCSVFFTILVLLIIRTRPIFRQLFWWSLLKYFCLPSWSVASVGSLSYRKMTNVTSVTKEKLTSVMHILI